MDHAEIKKSFYAPWSMMKYTKSIVKSTRPSVFIDMDEREFTASSISDGFELAVSCLTLGVDIFVFEKFRAHCPAAILNKINFINQMKHSDYLRFISTIWFYASGIRGSYEYTVLESACLGCGLISIKGAILVEHRERSAFIEYWTDSSFCESFENEIKKFDQAQICLSAEKLYPRNASKILIKNIEEYFLGFN